MLSQMIFNGWPENASDVPMNLRKNLSHASTLTVEGGIILQGEVLLIPGSKWPKVLPQLHNRHQGIIKMNLWAQNVIYWPGITKDIEQIINSCNTWQCFQVRQCDLPQEKQPTTDCPWQIMASDLFAFSGGQYMVMANMYSKISFV